MTVRRTVHLIGGGPGAFAATRGHIRTAVAALGKQEPLVAYVGVASGDDAGFFAELARPFRGAGARIELARLARKNANVARARALLDDCDLVFLSGGDVEHGMNVLRDRGVDEHLRTLARQGKPFAGMSAGSIMAGQSWVRFPDDDDAKAETFPCLGIAPVHLDAHSEDDGWSELRVLVRLLARKQPRALGYGVPSRGCLRVDLSGTRPRLTALGAPITRLTAGDTLSPLNFR